MTLVLVCPEEALSGWLGLLGSPESGVPVTGRVTLPWLAQCEAALAEVWTICDGVGLLVIAGSVAVYF